LRRHRRPPPGSLGVKDALTLFAAEVGSDGPVTVVGGRTQWGIGGPPSDEARLIAAPTGVVAHEPAEMIVRVRAGTALGDLQQAVGESGQFVALEADRPAQATVGGLLAVGYSGYRRRGWGPLRDAVLEITAVTSKGDLVRSGAPLVKNVTGFDLCRLLVGSLGTLALTGEVVLRCRPLPQVEAWYIGEESDPFALSARLYRPMAVLWDGLRTWVGLAGYGVDVEEQARTVLGTRFRPTEGPPAPPGEQRRSLPSGALRDLPRQAGGAVGNWLAEVGVGVVHCTAQVAAGIPRPEPALEVVGLHRAIKERFDPDGRLNPGRSVLAASGEAAA
jgi:FAD/FMN-containing dehydrogenase